VFIMPFCSCISGACHERGGMDPLTSKPKGLNISARTYEKHLLEDKILAVKESRQLSTHKSRRSLPIFPPVHLQIVFPAHLATLVADFGPELTAMRLPFQAVNR
jgi:hypothetical protein